MAALEEECPISFEEKKASIIITIITILMHISRFSRGMCRVRSNFYGDAAQGMRILATERDKEVKPTGNEK